MATIFDVHVEAAIQAGAVSNLLLRHSSVQTQLPETAGEDDAPRVWGSRFAGHIVKLGAPIRKVCRIFPT